MSKNLTSSDIKENENNEENEDLEVLLKDTPEEEPIEKVTAKPKRQQTEKQKEVFEKARLARLANIELKKQQKEQEQLEAKKKKEELIVKKAVAIKKKEIKQRAILEEISDEDTPVEKIRTIAKKIIEPVREPTFYEKYKFV